MNQPTRLEHIEFELCQTIQKQGSPRLQGLIKLCTLRAEQIDDSVIVKLSAASSIINLKILKLLAAEIQLLGQPLGVKECKVDWQAKDVFMVMRGEEIAFVASLLVDELGVEND